MNRERKENENFRVYRQTQKREGEASKNRLKGQLFWDSQRQGTYVRQKAKIN